MAKFIERSDVLSVGIDESDQRYAASCIQAGANPRLKKRSWASRHWDQLKR
jgi:hypothetical protein